MAHVRDPPASRSLHQPRNTTKVDVVPKVVKKDFMRGVTKAASKMASKAIEFTAVVNTGTESATAVEASADSLKCTHDGVDDGNITTITKKARGASTIAADVDKAKAQPARCSIRTQLTKTPVEKKRKRHTKAEIEADKARVEMEKKRKDELVVEKEHAIAMVESGEEFPGIDDVPSSDDTEDEVVSDGVVDVEKLKKANKAMQNTIKVLRKQGGGSPKKSVVGGKIDKSGHKLGKKAAYASGLCSGWDSGKSSTNAHTHVQISAGGLDDSDADAINPFLPSVQSQSVTGKKSAVKFTRNFSRQNKMISTVKIVNKATAAVVPHPRAKRAPVTTTSKVTSNSGPIKTEKQHDPSSIKSVVGEAERELKGKQLCGNSIVDEVYPEVDYTVTATESIHFLAYNRINEKRSSLGSSAIRLLEAHVGTLGGETAAKEWLCWCLWPGGPLLFRTPSPIQCEEPPPEGRLLSPFVITLTKSLLKLRAGSVLEKKPPQGLVALIAAALKRAARYLYNLKQGLTNFSKDMWGAHVEAYWKSFQPNIELGNAGIEHERWNDLEDVCSEKPKELNPDTLDADLSILDDMRPLIFNFKSPSKLCH